MSNLDNFCLKKKKHTTPLFHNCRFASTHNFSILEVGLKRSSQLNATFPPFPDGWTASAINKKKSIWEEQIREKKKDNMNNAESGV